MHAVSVTTMPDSYEILTVNPEWLLGPEAMGSKTKFWYRQLGDQKRDWLFKFPQPNTGQHWAEKIAAQVAGVMGIRHAQVELAVFLGDRGSVTESFARGGRDLWHGNQVLAGSLHGYDPGVRFHQTTHTLSNIWKALDGIFTTPDSATRAKLTIAEYTVLDAVIGNTDRHHENWGILRKRVGRQWRGFMAPSFDHASSLGRELLDERRELLLEQDQIGRYVERGRGGIYWADADRHAPSPLDLVRRASHADPNLFRLALSKLQTLNERSIQDTVDRVPASWMTSLARRFALALILYNLSELRRLI